MSGGDELDEAIALANGSAGAAHRTAGGRATGRTADGRSASVTADTGVNAEPPRPRGTGGDRDRERGNDRNRERNRGGDRGNGTGTGRTGPTDRASTERSRTDDDDLAAPDWLAPRSSRSSRTDALHRSRTADETEAEAHPRDVPWPDARTLAARTAGPLPSRTLPLDEALHHTLDAPLDALTDLPSFDTSAMDGWAVSGPGPWTLPDDPEARGVLAGATSEPLPLPDGRAVPIATGARIPPGANAVLRHEYGETDGTRLRTSHRPQPGTDIRPRGQECRSGDRLLPAGTQVTPAVLGLAAAAGYDRLTVVRRPRAEVLVLGDELLHRGVPRDGRIRDALGPAVAPWLSALGADVIVTRRLGDDAEALHEAVATTTADLIVTTGGTARGPVDHLRPTLARVGARLLIEGVRVRPGHPMLLARLPGRHATGHGDDGGTSTGGDPGGTNTGDGTGTASTGGSASHRTGGTVNGPYLVGLPGNPLAALSGLVTLAEPLIRTLADRPGPPGAAAGRGAGAPPRPPGSEGVFARLTDDVQGHPRDTRLVPVAFSPAEPDTKSRARPLRYNGPAMLRGVATATAFAVVPPGGLSTGTAAQMLPLPWFAW
ncbi:molybdopterin molybdenumtransferase MoeA [Streptomyces sp. HNM0575]|uniref:molybdopterin molybdotransferase MoeA n=1 Tax=Streptomyces sp. HNM0575 TaxID=2716338 RepID=UPI00145F9478|nr:molybdopterin molybdotransferase MoeA [Streptomyces sp. HNM0575]NLU76025.1 molybdopterin molybdenumtransferase MoeA [Streptomyces sp. HNM0575]